MTQGNARSIFSRFGVQGSAKNFGIHPAIKSQGYEYEGLPYVGTPYDLKDKDPDDQKPQLAHKGQVAILDLSQEDDLQQYRHIVQRLADGKALHSAEERVYDPESKNWRVFIRWLEPFYEPPANIQGARHDQPKQPSDAVSLDGTTSAADTVSEVSEPGEDGSGAPGEEPRSRSISEMLSTAVESLSRGETALRDTNELFPEDGGDEPGVPE